MSDEINNDLPEDARIYGEGGLVQIPQKGMCYLIRASTGCTCCAEENFIEGPWRTQEALSQRTASLKEQRRLRSQYSDHGVYSMIEIPYEIADSWIILDGQYAVKRRFIEDQEYCYEYEIDAFKKDWRL